MKEDLRNFKFEVRERSFLSPSVCTKLIRNLHDLGCYDQRWFETLKSIEGSGELHKYLSGDPRFAGLQRILRYEGENGISVIVLTTISSRTGTVKRTGSGWVMIIDRRSKRPYFWFELRRTRRFAARIVSIAKLFISIVNHWPTCPVCKEDLQLVTVKGFMLMRAFTCLNQAKKHFVAERPYFLITAMPDLSEEHHNMLKDAYDQYYMYRAAEVKEGNERGYACVIRSQKNERKRLAREMKLAISRDYYGDNKNEPKKGETFFYNDGPHTE